MGNCGSLIFSNIKYKKNRRRNRLLKPDEIPDLGLGHHYKAILFLGWGCTGETYLMREEATNRSVAVKVMERPIPIPVIDMLKRELQTHSMLGEGHLNIVNVYEVILTETHLVLVQEYASGGSLINYVSTRHDTYEDTLGYNNGLSFPEDEALYFFRQLVSAVNFCHKHRVMHRDLKLDNALLDSSDPPLIKLCDFGFAKSWEKNGNANTQSIIGTPVYMAPEILASGIDHSQTNIGTYDGKSADIWSMGILLFAMLMGGFPFDHLKYPDPNSESAYTEMLKQQTESSWSDCIGTPVIKQMIKFLSPPCQNLLDRMLTLNPNKRIKMEEITKHPWFNRELSAHLKSSLDQLNHTQARLDKKFFLKKSQHITESLNALIEESGTTCKASVDSEVKGDNILFATEKIKRISLRTGFDDFTKDNLYNGYDTATKKDV